MQCREIGVQAAEVDNIDRTDTISGGGHPTGNRQTVTEDINIEHAIITKTPLSQSGARLCISNGSNLHLAWKEIKDTIYTVENGLEQMCITPQPGPVITFSMVNETLDVSLGIWQPSLRKYSTLRRSLD